MSLKKKKENFLSPVYIFATSFDRTTLSRIDLKSFTIARINSMSTKLERLPIVRRTSSPFYSIFDRWKVCGPTRLYKRVPSFSCPFYTHVIDLCLWSIFSPFFSSFLFPRSETRALDDSFAFQIISRKSIYTHWEQRINPAHKNRDQIFHRRTDPWDILYI